MTHRSNATPRGQAIVSRYPFQAGSVASQVQRTVRPVIADELLELGEQGRPCH
jgi:hypothetical protein